MAFPGQSGRVIVGGDVIQDKSGSEFHSYEFDPVCPLPFLNRVLRRAAVTLHQTWFTQPGR